MNSLNQRKLLSAVCHGSSLLTSVVVAILIPIVILVASNDPIVQENAREAINFSINLFVYGVLFFVLSFVLIGLPLLLVLFAVSLLMPLIAIAQVATNPQKPYRYPLIWRVL